MDIQSLNPLKGGAVDSVASVINGGKRRRVRKSSKKSKKSKKARKSRRKSRRSRK